MADSDAQDTGGAPRAIGIPVHLRGESVVSVGACDCPPPLGSHRQILGDAHLRAPWRQVRDGGSVPNVHGRPVALGAARAVRAIIACAHVDVHARMPE